MTNPFVTHAFIAGELDEPFYGRVDLEKYDLGVALAENFTVDFRGGLKSRPGTKFCDFTQPGRARLFNFRTGEESADILVVVQAGLLRLMQEGEYLLDDAITVTGISGGVVTANAHGFSNGDLVFLDTDAYEPRVYRVHSATTNTFEIDFPTGVAAIPSGSFTAGEVSPLLTFSTPYSAADMTGLRTHFRLNSLFFTHPDHPPHRLIFEDGEFDFEPVPFGPSIGAPTGLSAATEDGDGDPGSGDASTVIVVTAVDNQGQESIGSTPRIFSSLLNYTTTAGSLSVSWNPVAGADYYKVYRSIITENSKLNRAAQVGLIGETRAPSFVDNNIIPDYTLQPPINFNPFSPGAVLEIEVSNGGSGYSQNTTVSVSVGSGFVGFPVVVDGEIIAIIVLAGGTGYTTSSTVSFGSTGGGSGASASVESVAPADGIYPRAATTFQQRRIYGGSRRLPLSVWGSKPGAPENFDASPVTNDGDAYNFILDAEEIIPIRHLVPIRDGLLILHARGVDRLIAEQGKAVTPINKLIENQALFGVGNAPPVVINNDVLFANNLGTACFALSYTFYTNSYTPQDLSVLAPHLLGAGQQPLRLAWVEEPDKLMWLLREDGQLLSLTYMREQEIFAWARHWTRGLVRDIVSVQELDREVLYLQVERFVNGQHVWLLEKLMPRNYRFVEDFWAVDSGVELEENKPAVALAVVEDHNEGTATLTALSAAFGSAQEGDVVRAVGGKYVITDVVSSTEVETTIIRRATEFVPGTETPRMALGGAWSLLRPVTEMDGLEHLEGELVSILADGDALDPRVVQDGKVPLDFPATRVRVGQGFTCQGKSLPLQEPELRVEGRKRRIVGTAVRLLDTRGLEIGTREDRLYEMKDKGHEDWGQVTELRSDNSLVFHAARWERDGQIIFRQRYPLPAMVLGFVTEAEVGDG